MKSLFLFACLGLAACSAPVDTQDHPAPTAPAPAVDVAPAPVAHTTADRTSGTHGNGPVFAIGGRGSQPSVFVCRAGAFCDDFEDATLGVRWSNATMLAGGKIVQGAESASAGRGSLRVSTRDEGSSAFLLEQKGDVTAAWSGALAFAFRVDQLPATSLGGPELSVDTKDGPITLRIVLEPAGLVLQQLSSGSCARARCAPTSRIIAPALANHWYQVRLGFEVNPHQAAPYGLVESSVDDGDVLASELTVPMFDGPMALRAGLTAGDTRPALADLDDVSLLVR